MASSYTESEKRVVARIERSKRFVKSNVSKRKKKIRKQVKEGGKNHVAYDGKLYAVLWKMGDFAQNGYNHLSSDEDKRKDIYDDFPHIAHENSKISKFEIKRFRDDEEGAFSNAPVGNFHPRAEDKSGLVKYARQKYPYPWQAHHIIPASAFYLEDKNKNVVFDDAAMTVLLQSSYNVNHGHNIINLPGQGANKYVPIHSLLQHPTDHPEYTKMVQEKLGEIAEQIDKVVGKKGIHKGIVSSCFKMLVTTEDSLWNEMVSSSRNIVSDILEGKELDSGIAKKYGDWARLC
ncbi:MAG: AHH domain-containing protein [Pseudomonadales bacterium]|nr:AHH domain-containing protein [Pseudomonadales bacterium]